MSPSTSASSGRPRSVRRPRLETKCAYYLLRLGQYLLKPGFSVIAELLARFKKAVETGDDSHIPPDLVRTTYRIVRTLLNGYLRPLLTTTSV